MKGSCEGYGEYQQAKKGSLEEFLLERYYLFTSSGDYIKRGRISHERWNLKKARPKILINDFLESYSLGVTQLLKPDFCHISDGVEVKAYPLEHLD